VGFAAITVTPRRTGSSLTRPCIDLQPRLS
jgi:hypothetical protein